MLDARVEENRVLIDELYEWNEKSTGFMSKVLPKHVKLDLGKLAVSGHSYGGVTALVA